MGKKRIISALLSVTMVVTMVPFMVSAAPDTNTPGTFTELQALIDQGGLITLDRDYVAVSGEGSLKVTNGGTIDLNGHTIDRNLSSADPDGHVFRISGGELAIVNDSTDAEGTITGGFAENGGGIYFESPSKFIIRGITITGNHATSRGGGIYLSPEANYCEMTNMKITDNSAEEGGGIYNAGASLRFIDGLFPSLVSGNTATTYGGGVYNSNKIISRSMNITGNTAGIHGGGLYQHPVSAAESGILEIGYKISINENVGDDLYLCAGENIIVATDFQSSCRIGVATEEQIPVVITSTGDKDAYLRNATQVFFTTMPQSRINFDKDPNSSTKGEVIIEPLSVGFVGCSMTLDGRIGLNVFVDLSALTDEQKASAKVSFAVPGKGANTQEDTFDPSFVQTVDDIPCYGFTCYLSSIQMAEQIVPTLTYTGGSLTSSKAYSVTDYIANISRSSYSNPITPYVANAMGTYGHFAQKYLSDYHGWSIGGSNGYAEIPNFDYNSTFSASYDDYKDALASYAASKSVGPSIESTKFKLLLENTTGIEVTFTLKSGVTEELQASCTYGGKTYTAYKSGDRQYKIRIEGIYAQDLDKMITINGTVGGSENFSATVSVFGYMYAALSNPQSSNYKKDAMCALYSFWNMTNVYNQVGQQMSGGN